MSELYELPDGWEWKKLGELCNFIRGPFGGSLKKQIFKESGNAVYEQSHAIYNQFEQIRYFIDDEKFEEMKRFELRPNSLIMSCSGTIGKVAIVPNNIKKGIINQALLMLTPNNELNNVFLKLMMESNFFQTLLSENSTGAAIANVASVKVLKEIKIPLPPLSEQQRIVSKLDLLFEKIDKSIALHQKNMDEADLFMGSVLNDVFGELEEKYTKKKLKDIVDNHDGTRVPIKSAERDSMQGEYPYYGASGIIDYVNDYIFDGEYLLISEDGANLTVRKYPIAFIAKGKFWVNNHAHVVKAKENISTNRFMEYAFAYTNISAYITGSAQPKMSQGKMNIIEFSIPPIKIQQKVVKYLDEISEKLEKIKSVQKEKMDSLVALKASILDKAFRGGL